MENFWKIVGIQIDISLILIIIFFVIFILLENRSPVKTISWILFVVFFPIVGVLFYFFLGRNYRKQRAFVKKSIKDFKTLEKIYNEQPLNLKDNKTFHHPEIEEKIGSINLLINNNKALLTENNIVSVLNNGDETFSAFFEELKKAKHHIHFEFFIIKDGIISNRIREILIKKAKEGVKVRVIYDGFGSWSLSDEYVDSLKEAGVEVFSFMPVRFHWFTTRINYRNHRKIIVIDGKIGFVGGLNIADYYLTGIKEIGIWRDTHIKIEGDAVKSLQVIFLIDWHFVSNQFINEPEYFPEFRVDNKCLIQIASSGPDSDWASIMQAFFYTIATARKYVYIATPYFLPNESILMALKTTALSGVDVRILLPSKSDSQLTFWGSMSYISELVESNIKFYMYEKGFTHSKLIISDDIFASVGTANMDIRSFDQNFEVSALIYDKSVTDYLKKSFLEDLTYCQQITIESFDDRPFQNRIRESLARIFSPLL